MNTLTDEQLERIDQYLSSELNSEESAEIKELITKDPAWAEAYSLRIAAREASRHVFHNVMRNKFSDMDASARPRRSISPLWLLAAACAAALVTAMLWLLPSRPDQDLFAEYRTFPNIVLPIEKSGAEISNRHRAYQAYELGEYAQAIAFYTQLDSVVTSDRLYLGLSYLESGDYANAGSILEEVRATSNPRWSEVADWYQVWSYLRQDKKHDAQSILTHIAQMPNHRYFTEAEKLLAQIKGK